MSTTTAQSFTFPPPTCPFALISFPTPQILLVTFNRPSSLNAIPTPAHHDLDALFTWYDTTPSLRCAIVTGAGRAFCAGADLKEWHSQTSKNPTARREMPSSGFGALSRRTGKKPIIAAVNGLAFGGGMEMIVNMDIVVASKSAQFALPEVKRGVVAIAGALPRLIRAVGRQRAMEMALTGRTVSAAEAHSWGLVNHITNDFPPEGEVLERSVVKKAIELAVMICNNSPDSVIVSRAGVVAGWEDGSVEHASTSIAQVWSERLNSGENIKEGLAAFVGKRGVKWVDSKL